MKNLKGLHVVVTAGPTREYLDPVRFLSNPSTGQMGYALATAAQAAGAKVTLISGPVALEKPKRIKTIDVISAQEMARVTLRAAKTADIIIMSAAVADYQAARPKKQKMKKGSTALTLCLVRTPDILATLGKRKKADQFLVGFAAETKAVQKNARAKLKRKNCDMLIANQVKAGNAFGSASNQVIVLYADGRVEKIPRLSKIKLAERLVRLIARGSPGLCRAE